MLLGRRTSRERPEITALAGPRVDFARIEAVLSRLELADHDSSTPPIIGNGIIDERQTTGALPSDGLQYRARLGEQDPRRYGRAALRLRRRLGSGRRGLRLHDAHAVAALGTRLADARGHRMPFLQAALRR